MSDQSLGVIAIVLVALLCVERGRAWLRSVRARARMARARAGERTARTMLLRRGFDVLAEQARGSIVLRVDGAESVHALRADYLVSRHGRRFVAEVKTGGLAPSLDHAPTRRQILEYCTAFDVDGALLVDPENDRVRDRAAEARRIAVAVDRAEPRARRRARDAAPLRLARGFGSSEGLAVTSPLVSPEALLAELEDPFLVLLDARAGADARERFATRHLRGARFVSGDHDLAAPKDPARGGRHPLPTLEDFAATLARLGITASARIVVYDDKNGTNPAARAWWMLRAVGLDARVLDGGLAAAVNLPTESGDPTPTPAAAMTLDRWQRPLVSIDQVEASAEAVPVLDARSASRHRGEADPFDPRPGHIPHTRNAPHEATLDASGRMLDAATLRARFEAQLGGRSASDAIVYCGSGVTACHLLLAMEHAGLPGASLYVGSFSEWTRQDRPVATGEGT